MMNFFRRLFNRGREKRIECTAIIAAAGSSTRMGGENKLLHILGGKPVIVHVLQAIDASESVDEIIIATRESDLTVYADLCKSSAIRKPVKIVVGGAAREESVLRAALEADQNTKFFAVQDGARPFVTPELIDKTVALAKKHYAVAPAVHVHDTIKVARGGVVESTPDRSTLFAVQTPQVFDAGLLKAALQSAIKDSAKITDDCSAVERIGKAVYLTEGDEENIKLTTPLDFVLADTILERRGN